MTNQETIPTGAAVGQLAPRFTLPSLRNKRITLADYRGQKRIVLWFSRGFTCNFCRTYMESIIRPYPLLAEQEIEVIQVAPNLPDSARLFFDAYPPYPFVCDPDKRLYATYNLGDRGALEASRNTVVSFAKALTEGEGLNNVRGSWLDVANRNFIRRLHHHALTAVDQGIFILDEEGIIRYRKIVGSIDPVPSGEELLRITETVC
jgi:peroxiredoxin